MKFFKILISGVISFFIFSCNNTPDNGIIHLPFPIERVNVIQDFSYKNQNGENLLEKGVYKEKYLSLICTDENGDDLYINGQLVADIENIVEIRNRGNGFLTLFFGRDYSVNENNNSAIGYYKLKYDEDKYDTIIVNFYHNMKDGTDHYINKVIYNGVEYPYSKLPIEIIKEE